MASVRFPDAEAMESVQNIACGDVTRASGRSSWVKLKTRLSDGGIQVFCSPMREGPRLIMGSFPGCGLA